MRPAPGAATGNPSEGGGDLPRIYPVPSVQHLQELSVNLNSLSGEPSRQQGRDHHQGNTGAASHAGSNIRLPEIGKVPRDREGSLEGTESAGQN